MSISEVRLAGRRWARDPEDLALLHGEGHVVHGHGIAVALVHVRYFDDRAIPPAALPVLRGRGRPLAIGSFWRPSGYCGSPLLPVGLIGPQAARPRGRPPSGRNQAGGGCRAVAGGARPGCLRRRGGTPWRRA